MSFKNYDERESLADPDKNNSSYSQQSVELRNSTHISRDIQRQNPNHGSSIRELKHETFLSHERQPEVIPKSNVTGRRP